MRIEYDRAKRDRTFAMRGLDFARAEEVFEAPHADSLDLRQEYGEVRTTTFGKLDGRWVVIIWTPRGDARRVISMRYANAREIKIYSGRVC